MTLPDFLHPFARPCATDFLRLVRGEGALVHDDRGLEYVDAMGALWFCHTSTSSSANGSSTGCRSSAPG